MQPVYGGYTFRKGHLTVLYPVCDPVLALNDKIKKNRINRQYTRCIAGFSSAFYSTAPDFCRLQHIKNICAGMGLQFVKAGEICPACFIISHTEEKHNSKAYLFSAHGVGGKVLKPLGNFYFFFDCE